MNKKSVRILILLPLFLIFFSVKSHSEIKSDDTQISAQNFIEKFYEDLEKGDPGKIKDYFHGIKDEELKNLMLGSRNYPVSKTEFMGIITSYGPEPIIKITVKEFYKPGHNKIPYSEVLFTLKDFGSGVFVWKIMEFTKPGLP